MASTKGFTQKIYFELATKRGAELLEQMHKIDVRPHQIVYVPPGVLHGIGVPIFIVEVKEWGGFEIMARKRVSLAMDSRRP